MIKHVRITGFKSLANVSVKLDPVTVLIGRSGTGKSNFVEGLRFLRDYLTERGDGFIGRTYGGWHRVMSATAARPKTLSFGITFTAPGMNGDYEYTLTLQQQPDSGSNDAPQFRDETLRLGDRVLFFQQHGKWVQQPPLASPPQAGPLMLGALTGIQEVTIAHLVLTSGIGCYAFPDHVLTQPGSDGTGSSGLADNGNNFLQAFTAINVNLKTWHHLRSMAASLRSLKSSLKSIDLQLPQRQQVVVTHEFGGKLFVFDLSQESEGFRRLLACLIALYQEPPKETLLFDEPEKGIYPVGLSILADEFKGYASKGKGQVILTTHSPEFLDKFSPEQIRVVEMHDGATNIGPVAPEQLEALREHFLKPADLLTVDEARLEGSLAQAG